MHNAKIVGIMARLDRAWQCGGLLYFGCQYNDAFGLLHEKAIIRGGSHSCSEFRMSSVKHIQFTNTINAPAAVVWRHITSLDSYKHWTSAFAEGSHFEGSWEQGSKIRFLSPGGDGMVAEIAESRKNEFLSIRHLGFIANGVEDTTSEAIRAWAPAYENYTLLAVPDGTRLVVDQDVAMEWEEHMDRAWPKALKLLKELCESSSAA